MSNEQQNTHSDLGVPLDGGEACRTGWTQRANPHPKDTLGYGLWRNEWSDAAAELWQAHLDDQHAATVAGEPKEVRAKVLGYQQASDASQAAVNELKRAEERTLRLFDGLRESIMEEVGAIAKEDAEFTATGHARMSVNEQRAKRDELQDRMKTAQEAMRNVALARTHLEDSFMRAVRAIFRPRRIDGEV